MVDYRTCTKVDTHEPILWRHTVKTQMVYRIIISPEAHKQSSGTQINKSLEKFHLWPHKSQNGQTIYLS